MLALLRLDIIVTILKVALPDHKGRWGRCPGCVLTHDSVPANTLTGPLRASPVGWTHQPRPDLTVPFSGRGPSVTRGQ